MTSSAIPTFRSMHSRAGTSPIRSSKLSPKARDILLRIPGVAKVDLLGTQDERILIEVSSAALAERGLSSSRESASPIDTRGRTNALVDHSSRTAQVGAREGLVRE